MSPRKRLSPSHRSSSKLEDDSVEENSITPPLSPHVARKRIEEQKMIRLVCWINIILFLGAIATVAVVEHRNHDSPPTIRTLRSQHRNLLFQSKSITGPVCGALASEDVTFSLVTQCSESRLWMLKHHCARWKGPMSLAVYTNRTHHQVSHDLQSLDCPHDRVALQIFPSDGSLVDYPINALRNLAFAAVETSHAVYLDIDFWPSSQLEEELLRHQPYLAASNLRALILPAFSLMRQCREWRECPEQNLPAMPATQQDVYDGLMAKRMFPFDPTNRGAHGSTRYQDWIKQSADEILPIDCFESQRYEPYLVVRYCRDLPPFQEGFAGYGKNKVTWLMQLRRAGWTFGQVGKAFCVHYPHLDSPARQAWNGGGVDHHMHKPVDESRLLETKRGGNDHLFVEFRNWLDQTYTINTVQTPLCEGAMNDDTKLWVPRTGLPPSQKASL
jgi:hypothetical protein